MNNYALNIRKSGSYYCSILLKADFKEDAIKQANEIMNRFPEREFSAELQEQVKNQAFKTISWFN